MDLPRPAQIRHELSEIGITYGLVIAIILIGFLIHLLGGATHLGVVPPAAEPMGPGF